jgi:hypothetical protein
VPRARSSSLVAFAALLALAAGCSLRPEPIPGDTAPQIVDLPYEGTAFPSRRPPFEVPAGGALFAVSGDADRLTAFDAARGDEVREVPIGRDPVGLDGPTALAVDVPRNVIYVALAYPDVYTGAHVHEGSPLGAIETISLDDLRVLGEIDVDVDPRALALSEDGSSLVVTHFFEQGLADALAAPEDIEFARGRTVRIDPEDFGDPDGANPPKARACVGSSGLSLSKPDGARAMVACYGEDALAVVPLDEPGAEATRFPVGDAPGVPGAPVYGPTAAVLSPDGMRVAMPCALSNDVRIVQVTDGSLAGAPLQSVGIPGTPVYSSDGARLLVPESDPGALVEIELASGTELSRTAIAASECSRPLELTHAGPGRLLLRCGDGALMLFDAADLSVVSRAFLGAPASAAVLLSPGAAR